MLNSGKNCRGLIRNYTQKGPHELPDKSIVIKIYKMMQNLTMHMLQIILVKFTSQFLLSLGHLRNGLLTNNHYPNAHHASD
jgi:hypothetical protein